MTVENQNFIKDLNHKDVKEHSNEFSKSETEKINKFVETKFAEFIESGENQKLNKNDMTDAFNQWIEDEMKKPEDHAYKEVIVKTNFELRRFKKLLKEMKVAEEVTETISEKEVKERKDTNETSSNQIAEQVIKNATVEEAATKIEAEEAPKDYGNDPEYNKHYDLHGDEDFDKSNIADTEMSDRKITRKVRKDVMNFLHKAESNNKFRGPEKQLMRKFANTVLKLNDKIDKETTTASEKIILDYIHNNTNEALSLNNDGWNEKLEELGVTIDRGERSTLKNLKLVAQAYEGANNPDSSSYGDLPGFRRFSQLIRETGSFEAAYDKFDGAMASSTETLSKSRADRLAAITENVDLNNIDDQIKLLVDFNLDGNVLYGDTGIKTGLQIQDMFGNVESKKTNSMSNLIKAFNKGKTEEVTKIDFTDEEKLTEVQNFLKNPPVELSYIFNYGADAFTEYQRDHADTAKEVLLTSEEQKKILEEANKAEKELRANLEEAKVNIDDLKQKEQIQKMLNMPKQQLREGLREVLEGQVINAKVNGMSAGVDFPLDDILKGLSFNVGASKDNLGINLAWNGSKELGEKGWGVYGGGSAGTTLVTIPIIGGGVGLYKEFTNKKIAKSLDRKTNKIGSAGVHAIVAPGTIGWGVDLGIDADRASAIEQRAASIENDTATFGTGILEALATGDEGSQTFKYDEAKLQEYLKDKFGEETKQETIDGAVKNLGSVLRFYDGLELTEDNKDMISKNLAESYAAEWKNQQLLGLDDKGWYISGGGLAVTFFQGIVPVIGILKFKRHKIESSTDTEKSMKRAKDAEYEGTGNKKLSGDIAANLDAIKDTLNLEKNSELISVMDDDMISISPDLWKDTYVKVSLTMKGLVKKTDAGELIIHPKTPIRAYESNLGDGKKTVLNIGAFDSDDADIILKGSKDVDSLGDDFFTDETIDVTKLPKLKSGITQEKVNEVVNSLGLTGLTFEVEDGSLEVKQGGVSHTVPEGHGLQVTKNSNGVYEFADVQLKDGENFYIENKIPALSEKGLDVSNEVDAINDSIYNEAAKITSNALRNIGHKASPSTNDLYTQWRSALKKSNFEDAKDVMLTLLPNMENYINKYQSSDNKIDFNQFADKLRTLEGTSRDQVLLCLDGLFSRTTNVKGTPEGNKYKLEGMNFDKMVAHNKKEILRKINNEGYPDGYSKMFNLMEEEYEKLNLDNDLTVTGINGIAYNYGNPDDTERPIINPKIVEGTLIDIEKESFEGTKEVVNHMVEELVNSDSAIIKPMIDKLNVYLKTKDSTFGGLNDKQLKDLLKNKSLDIDIGGENVTINCDYAMKAALFAQCVNHMLVMQDLNFSIAGETQKGEVAKEGIFGENVRINNSETDNAYTYSNQKAAIAAGYAFEKKEERIKEPDSDSGSTPGEDTKLEGGSGSLPQEDTKTTPINDNTTPTKENTTNTGEENL